MSTPFDHERDEEHDDDAFEREIFQRRARAIETPRLSVDDALTRGKELRAIRKNMGIRAVKAAPKVAANIGTWLTSHAGGSIPAAAAALLFIAFGVHSGMGAGVTRTASVAAQPDIRRDPSVLACGADDQSSLLTAVCEMPAATVLASRDEGAEPSSQSTTSAAFGACTMSPSELACESAPRLDSECGRDVTCALARP